LLIALIDEAEKLCPHNVSVTMLRPNRRRNTCGPSSPQTAASVHSSSGVIPVQSF
jgi:hypothetical protein